MNKHIFIVAGDASGDVYGAQLISALRKIDPDIQISGLGGDHMAASGMTFLYNLVREFSVMGFLPVILGMPKVMRFLEITLDYLDVHRPDAVVLIDYPGFNLYLATHTKPRKIPTIYYVTPQIWAWAPRRINKIKRFITKMLVIFPFEVPFYEQAKVSVEYVGHPLLDRLALFQADQNFCFNYQLTGGPMLGLLPGSRRAEIRGNLPVMLWAASEMANQGAAMEDICIALASYKYHALTDEILQTCRKKFTLPEVKIIVGDTYNVLSHSHFVMVTSGTATLETAMFGKPMVICYRVPPLHKWVVEHTSFLKCKYFGLPNIVSGRKIVPEFLIAAPYPDYVVEAALPLCQATERRQQCLADLAQMQSLLKEPGASEKAAKAIWQTIVPL